MELCDGGVVWWFGGVFLGGGGGDRWVDTVQCSKTERTDVQDKHTTPAPPIQPGPSHPIDSAPAQDPSPH